MEAAQNHGSQRFVADLSVEGVDSRIEGPAVVFTVTPIAGALVGLEVETAVSINELQSWPATVPHWLHFTDSIAFVHSNIDTNECLPGWRRHSRDIGLIDTTVPVIRTFLAHVRGALSSASKVA